jgi:hypothetical protein
MAPRRARAPWLSTSIAAPLALGLGGCSAPVEDVADASGAATRGLVTIERASTEGTTRTSVAARFMRVTPSSDVAVAEQLVGSTLEVPAAGRCAPLHGVGATDAVAPAPGTTSIDLLDVGDVSLASGNEPSMALATRAFPDLGDLVSGVFYTSRDAATELPAPARYVVRGTGSAAVDRFAIEAEAPSAPDDVRVGDAALAEGVSLEEGAPAHVRWTADRGARAEDVILVDVTSTGGVGARCAFVDGGEGVLPASAVGAALGADGRATVTVHRVRREAFAAPGLDAGEIRFDLAVSGRATVARAPRP